MTEFDVVIKLTSAEAVVLDEFLRRYSLTDQLRIEDSTEKQALWNLQCQFEKDANRPLWPELEVARDELRIQE